MTNASGASICADSRGSDKSSQNVNRIPAVKLL
jgi:hypothetical protein